MSITTQVVVLFIVVLVGVACRRLGYLDDASIHGMTQLVVYVTLPCMTIVNMQRPFAAQVLKNFALAFVLCSVVLLISLGLCQAVFRNRPREKRAVLISLAAFSNCGFMGYPIIEAVNPDWIIYAVACNVAFLCITWTLGVSLFTGKGNISLRRVLLHPNLVSAAIGFALFCLGITIPAMPAQALSLVGGLTTPLSMLLIGTRVYGVRLSDFRDRDYHISAALRLVVLPLLVYLALRPFHLPAEVFGVLFILSAMPSPTMTGMQAELYGGDTILAARGIAYTTLLSLISVPLLSLLM